MQVLTFDKTKKAYLTLAINYTKRQGPSSCNNSLALENS